MVSFNQNLINENEDDMPINNEDVLDEMDEAFMGIDGEEDVYSIPGNNIDYDSLGDIDVI